MGRALTALPAGAPQRNTNLVASDSGGRNMLLSDVFAEILLTDLPSGDAIPAQVLVWNGEAWAPASMLAIFSAALPTTQPTVAGALWSNGGVICLTS